MSLEKEKKLKQLYQLLPENVVAPSSWLAENGYSPQLLHKYVNSGWLQRVGRGAYLLANSTITWQSVVLGLQKSDESAFHVGGLTALNLQGFAHYLPLGEEQQITLYGAGKIPNWIKQIQSTHTFSFFKKPNLGNLGITTYNTGIRELQIDISTPERAIFELLYLVEKHEGITFTFVAEIFENLTTLRPKLLNQLLEACQNIRVKRLFLFFADHYNFAWAKYLDTENLNLGSGKMQIVQNGKFDKKYRITIPKDFQ